MVSVPVVEVAAEALVESVILQQFQRQAQEGTQLLRGLLRAFLWQAVVPLAAQNREARQVLVLNMVEAAGVLVEIL
jgi:AcrR family transcriptional regulator